MTLMKTLGEIDDSTTHFGESLAELFAGKTVEIYLGEKSGSTYYSDYDVEQKVYVTGKILGGKGQLLLIECEVVTPAATFHIPMALNGWAITGVVEHVPGRKIHISHLFQEIRR
jgi:hypothetical protein